eukprot:15353501-Ditylum_brightwellii.AAC.1
MVDQEVTGAADACWPGVVESVAVIDGLATDACWSEVQEYAAVAWVLLLLLGQQWAAEQMEVVMGLKIAEQEADWLKSVPLMDPVNFLS